MFLIEYDLFFQIQEKSRRLISKKGRYARFLKIIKLDQPGRCDLFCLSIDEIFLASERAGQILTIRNIGTSVLILTIKILYSS